MQINWIISRSITIEITLTISFLFAVHRIKDCKKIIEMVLNIIYILSSKIKGTLWEVKYPNITSNLDCRF